MKNQEIVNKVDQSGLVQLDLEMCYVKGDRKVFDMADFLHEGLVLKEKEYRAKLDAHNWELYRDTFVALTCSADAIVPTWAYMLAGVFLGPVARRVHVGSAASLEEVLFADRVQALDLEEYRGKRVVVKGCSEKVPVSAYVALLNRLQPVVKSIMYGEPCSTVPLYKEKK